MTVLIGGTDGCANGWLCIEQAEDGVLRPRLHRTTRELLAYAATIDLLTIDIPIGLTDDGPRQVDILARRLLGPRASSVFRRQFVQHLTEILIYMRARALPLTGVRSGVGLSSLANLDKPSSLLLQGAYGETTTNVCAGDSLPRDCARES